jgi:hypothetical protein
MAPISLAAEITLTTSRGPVKSVATTEVPRTTPTSLAQREFAMHGHAIQRIEILAHSQAPVWPGSSDAAAVGRFGSIFRRISVLKSSAGCGKPRLRRAVLCSVPGLQGPGRIVRPRVSQG